MIRIEHEIQLKDHNIPNLVKILDGGKTRIENEEYFFIVMEYVNGKNLKEYIRTHNYDVNFIVKVIKALVNTSDKLLEKNIAHRDIKPENIRITENGNVILLDLGVLKIVYANYSDKEEKQFIATLQYSPPELLLREEVDSFEGWRAINLYQIGGVAYDLIMKRELFYDSSPFGKLVKDILESTPKIENADIPYSLLQLTKNLLTKNWNNRLLVCTPEKITSALNEAINNRDEYSMELDALNAVRLNYRSVSEEIEKIKLTNDQLKAKKDQISQDLINLMMRIMDELKNEQVLPIFDKSTPFQPASNFIDKINGKTNSKKNNLLYRFTKNLVFGFSRTFYIYFNFENDENNFCGIEAVAFIVNPWRNENMLNPETILGHIFTTYRKENRIDINKRINIDTTEIFNGVISFDEPTIKEIKKRLVKLIRKIIDTMSNEVNDEFVYERDLQQGVRGRMRITSTKIRIVNI